MKTSVISEEFRARYLSRAGDENAFEVRAIVFEGPEDYHERINDPALAIDANCVLVIRHVGPIGYPGSAEVVNMQPPDALIKAGIRELPTIGDGRQKWNLRQSFHFERCTRGRGRKRTRYLENRRHGPHRPQQVHDKHARGRSRTRDATSGLRAASARQPHPLARDLPLHGQSARQRRRYRLGDQVSRRSTPHTTPFTLDVLCR